jgi:ubiquinone biosynthesis monooxygenase Coq7
MRIDEIEHGQAAVQSGGVELPDPVQKIMQMMSKVMTTTAYKI